METAMATAMATATAMLRENKAMTTPIPEIRATTTLRHEIRDMTNSDSSKATTVSVAITIMEMRKGNSIPTPTTLMGGKETQSDKTKLKIPRYNKPNNNREVQNSPKLTATRSETTRRANTPTNPKINAIIRCPTI